jgi:hypothetical protein
MLRQGSEHDGARIRVEALAVCPARPTTRHFVVTRPPWVRFRGSTRRGDHFVGSAGCVQVFRCRHYKTIHALWRPASEKRQGRKSRWVGHWRCRGLYGELASGCGAGRYDRSGRAGRFGSKVGCASGREGVKGVLRDPIDAVPGQSGMSTQMGAPPVESRPEWYVSVW